MTDSLKQYYSAIWTSFIAAKRFFPTIGLNISQNMKQSPAAKHMTNAGNGMRKDTIPQNTALTHYRIFPKANTLMHKEQSRAN